MTLVETQCSQLKTAFEISIYDLIVSGCDIMEKGLKLAMKEVCQLEDKQIEERIGNFLICYVI